MSDRFPRLLASLLLALGAAACSATQGPVRLDPAEADAAAQEDLVNRLAEKLENPEPVEAELLMNSLERLQLSWQSEQRKGRARQLEIVLAGKVLPNYDVVADMFVNGTHDRRLVAAWALGFTRVPENDMGVASRHAEAVALLVGPLETLPDDIMSNALLALWKIGEPTTPPRPVLDIAAHHHDAEVRANAMLAVDAILTPETASQALDTILLAFEDDEDKVRLHAVSVARHHPDPVYTERLETLLPHEQTPLVRANIAAALGAAGRPSSAAVLLPLLSSPRHIESAHARQALTLIFGEDLGPSPEAWREFIADS